MRRNARSAWNKHSNFRRRQISGGNRTDADRCNLNIDLQEHDDMNNARNGNNPIIAVI